MDVPLLLKIHEQACFRDNCRNARGGQWLSRRRGGDRGGDRAVMAGKLMKSTALPLYKPALLLAEASKLVCPSQ